ncbi:MAG: hypothetical protein FWG99_05510 [Treponema sp.]|nr:hypothetical protein [Treponema sp.]
MAIQPIDLQILFTQVDKVGRTQTAQQEGQAVQQAIQGAQLQRKTEELIQEVNEAQDSGDGAQKVNDRKQQSQSGGGGKNEKDHDNNGDGGGDQSSVFFDPLLGKNIDISL